MADLADFAIFCTCCTGGGAFRIALDFEATGIGKSNISLAG